MLSQVPSTGALLLLAAVLLLARGLLALVSHRRKYQNLPGPPHSFIFGHIVMYIRMTKSLHAPSVHHQVVISEIRQKYNLPHVFYLDLYPLTRPIIVIQDPSVAVEVMQEEEQEIGKDPFILSMLQEMTGVTSILVTKGQWWKDMRKRISPSFTSVNLSKLMPNFIDSVSNWRENLNHLSDTGETFALHPLASRLTLDIAGCICLGETFKDAGDVGQISDTFRAFLHAYERRSLIDWLPLIRHFERKRTREAFDRSVSDAVMLRSSLPKEERDKKPCMVDVLLGDNQSGHLPSDMTVPIDNIKTMLLAGQGSTSATFSWVVYLLSTNPEILKMVREEHDKVFDPDYQKTLGIVRSDPQRLKKLQITTCCINEALRLYPAGAIPRWAPPGRSITFQERELPLSGHSIRTNHFGLQRREDLWSEPDNFKPLRFMKEGPELNRSAFRPFEKGTRICMGKEMALTTMRLMLLLVTREFDFSPAYSAQDPKADDRLGGHTYMVFAIAAEPHKGMLLTVRKRR